MVDLFCIHSFDAASLINWTKADPSPQRRIAGLSTGGQRLWPTTCKTRAITGIPASLRPHIDSSTRQRTIPPRSTCRPYTVTAPRSRAAPLETQLGNDAAMDFLPTSSPIIGPPQTLTEKIAQRAAVGLGPDKKVKSGDYISIRPHTFMSHDNSWPSSFFATPHCSFLM